MNTKHRENCPFCGELTYYHQIKLITLYYKKCPIQLEQPGYWCDACLEGVIGGDDRLATQKILQTLRAEIDGILTPDEIKRIREKLKLSQRAAADLFGGGVNAFSRYERGETPAPKALCQLLLLLDKHPNLSSELISNTHAKQGKAIHSNKGLS